MQTYLNVRAMNVGQESAQATRGVDPARAIPAGRESSATVISVSQNPTQPNQFILQLQLGSRTLELSTPRPFPQGSQVLISRDAQGNIQLQLPTTTNANNANSNSVQNAAPQARANTEAILMRISTGSAPQASNLPINQSQRGVVLPQANPTPSAPQSGQPSASTGYTQVPAGNTTPANTAPMQNASGNVTAQAPSSNTTSPANTNTGQVNTSSPATTGTNTPALNNAPTGTATAIASASRSAPSSQANTQQPGATQNTVQTSGANRPATAPVADNANQLRATAQANNLSNINPAPVMPRTVASTTINSTMGNNLATSPQSTPIPGQTATSTPQITSNTNAQQANLPPTSNSPLANMLGQNEAINRPQGFPVRVLVAGQVIDLVSPRPVQAGQQVDVTRNEQGLIRIQFPQPTTPLAQQPAVQSVMQQALREVLPMQLPLADGLNQLMQLSERQGARQNSALNQLIQSMLSLFSVKPGAADAEKAIARNLQQGGLLSEASLSRTGQQQPPPTDLKQQLGQLLRVADQLPPQAREQLNQLVNALLARSTAQQISSLQRWRDLPDGGQERHYRLDLPIQQQQGFENAELRITEHRRRNEEGDFVTLWTVRLHFELEEEGAMDAELSLQDSFELQAHFWVEKPETLQRLRERLSSFEEELKTKGFAVAPLNARLGKLENPQVTPLSKRLVDIHT